jgi:hypothetical protein
MVHVADGTNGKRQCRGVVPFSPGAPLTRQRVPGIGDRREQNRSFLHNFGAMGIASAYVANFSSPTGTIFDSASAGTALRQVDFKRIDFLDAEVA